MVLGALSKLARRDEPPQKVNDELPTFNDPLLLLHPHAAAEPVSTILTTVLMNAPYHHPAAHDSHDDDILLVSIRAQSEQDGTAPFLPSSASTPTARKSMDKLDEDCWDSTDDVDPSDFERAAEGPMRPHPKLDTLSFLLTLAESITARRSDELFSTVIQPQSAENLGVFFEDMDGLLKQKHRHYTDTVEIVVLRTLRPT